MNKPFDENPNPQGLKPPKPKKKNPNAGKELVQENLAIKAMTLMQTGLNYSQIAYQLGKEGINVTPNAVKRMVNSDEAIKFQTELNNEMQRLTIAVARQEGPKLVQKALQVLYSHLEKDNLHAAALAFKITKVAEENVEKVVDSNITIVLPGAEEPKTINATYETVD